MSSVYKEWFTKMPWKMQSILSNGLRAPDVKTDATKKVVRFLRTKACNNADPTKADCYMSAPPLTTELLDKCVDELEYLTCHYVHHLADAMRVLSLYYEDGKDGSQGSDNNQTRIAAAYLHNQIAEEIFHFIPETNEQFMWRHRDKVSHEDPATQAPSPSTPQKPMCTCCGQRHDYQSPCAV